MPNNRYYLDSLASLSFSEQIASNKPLYTMKIRFSPLTDLHIKSIRIVPKT